MGTLRKPDFAASAILVPAPAWMDDCSVVVLAGSFTSGTLRNPLAAASAIDLGLSLNNKIQAN